MKRKNKKLLTLMVVSALCATTLGGVAGLMNSSVSAYSPEDPKTYSLTSVFSAKSTAKIGAE